MLGKLGGWDNDLGAGNVVVWKENNLEKISNSVVVVHLLGNRGDQLDDGLSVVVTWGSLSSDHDNSWHKLVLSLVGWSIKNFKISVNAIEDVHHLSLVLMYSLDLDIIHSVNWDFVSGLLLDPFGESSLVIVLDFDESINKGLVSSVWHEELQVIESGDPLVNTSEGITDELGKFWVAAMDPSSWGNTVCLVLKLTWVKLIEFLEKGSLQKMRMEGSDTVDGVGAHNGEVSHSNLLGPSFFNETHSSNFLMISWIFLLQFGQINMVDQVNELQMSWQKSSHQFN